MASRSGAAGGDCARDGDSAAGAESKKERRQDGLHRNLFQFGHAPMFLDLPEVRQARTPATRERDPRTANREPATVKYSPCP